jgi:hypothetical protein
MQIDKQTYDKFHPLLDQRIVNFHVFGEERTAEHVGPKDGIWQTMALVPKTEFLNAMSSLVPRNCNY